MLKKIILKAFKTHFKYKPTNAQENALQAFSDFVITPGADNAFLLKGYAGTGKTTLLKAITDALAKDTSLNLKTMLLAPTGRAAKVLSNYTEWPAYTIHKKIYRQESTTDGSGNFTLDKNLHKNTLFIVDEASMIANKSSGTSIFGTGKLLDDLIGYVYSSNNCRLMLIGDTAQLPPVGMELSPALTAEALKNYPQIRTVYEATLTDVLRQAFDSGILNNATLLRNLIPEYKDQTFPKLAVRDFPDIHAIQGNDLIEYLTDAYSESYEETLVITRSNKRANRFNQGIRSSALWRDDEIGAGDMLMIVKNNYFWLQETEGDFIANGDMAEVTYVSGFQELYGFRFADVTLRFIDYGDKELDVKILLDTLHAETPSLSRDQNRTLYEAVSEDYQDIANKRKRLKAVRENEYFNALQVKFAYAVTCHKAQGGQWNHVFIDQGYMMDEMMNKEYLRWLYTAITRAKKHVYLLNFRREFFQEEVYNDW